MNGLLPLLIFLPLGAAVLLAALRSPGIAGGAVARWGALLASLATLGLSLVVASDFGPPPGASGASGPVQPRIEFRQEWLTFPRAGGETRLEFFVGMDGISLLLVVLTALLTVAAVLISWDRIRDRPTEFYALVLALETGLIGAFCSFDLILFYIFFEFTLIPLFFLVGMWGGPDRRRAARRFFIYTLFASLVTLVGLVALVMTAAGRYGLEAPSSIPDLAAALAADPLPYGLQVGLFLAIAFGFMVKVPLVPFHTWQPLAYVEAPTGVSVLLAGVVMKLGTYGFLRICLPLLPDATERVGVPLIATLSVVGILYGALCALAQRDMKRLVAYSSISHIGFCMLGLFALNAEGVSGGVLQMVNHGLSTGALFLLVGMVYDRYRTRMLTRLGGLASRLPLLAVCMVFICLSSVGLPGLNNFVGEFLSLAGMFAARPVFAAIGTLGVVLGAWYTLSMLQRGFFGPLREPNRPGVEVRDLRLREAAILTPLMALCLWIGVYPQPLIRLIEPDVNRVVALYENDAATGRSAVALDTTSGIVAGYVPAGPDRRPR
jgi:NADH-quinone oxidoreductase subunit M